MKHVLTSLLVMMVLASAAVGQSTGDYQMVRKSAGGHASTYVTPVNSSIWTLNGSGVVVFSTGIAQSLVTNLTTDLAGKQPLDADLTTWAGITPSANVQSFLGSADYAAMRSALSLVVGTHVQAHDADLTTWAGITPSANGQSLVSAADYAAMRSVLSLVVGTHVQAYDADLTTWAGITPSANVQTMLGAANYAGVRSVLGLDTGNAPTFADVTVTTEAYDATGWNGDNTVPTKDAVRDKMEAVAGVGAVVQKVVATTSTSATITASIPFDDSIPQNSEGTEVLTVSITPQFSSSKLLIEFDAWGTSDAVSGFVIAFFKDSAANAISARGFTLGSPGYAVLIDTRAVVDAGSTSAQTIKVRLGTAAGNFSFLGVAGSGQFSTSDSATLTVTEIKQ